MKFAFAINLKAAKAEAIKRKVVLNSPQTTVYADIRLAGHDDGDFVLLPR